MNGEQYDNERGAPQQPPYTPPQPAPAPRPADPARKSATLATVLSLMPGLGQVYVGYYQQGFINLLVVGVCIAILNMGAHGAEPLFGIFLAFFWLYNMVDANRRAHHYNRVLDGLGGERVPEDMELPGAKGSLPAGIVLVVAGVLFLLDLNTDFSMAWIEDWWPLILVGGGVWLIVKARRQGG